MDGGDKEEYKPSAEYEQEFREPLLDIELTDSTELWLFQWPYKQVSFFFSLLKALFGHESRDIPLCVLSES